MRVAAAAGSGFLLAVLWFDLMFDVQVRGHRGETVPAAVLASIAAYYARVTTGARPMNRLVPVAMVAAIGGLAVAVARDDARWAAAAALLLTVCAVSLAAVRTVRNAQRLGAHADAAAVQSTLARSILRDHIVCFVAIASSLAIQIAFL